MRNERYEQGTEARNIWGGEISVQGTEASTEGLIFFCIQFVVMNMLPNII